MRKLPLGQTIHAQALRRDTQRPGDRKPAGEVRTTYSLGSDARRALRTLAVSLDCPTNDLISIALEDFLIKRGFPDVPCTRPEVRQGLAEMAESRSSRLDAKPASEPPTDPSGGDDPMLSSGVAGVPRQGTGGANSNSTTRSS